MSLYFEEMGNKNAPTIVFIHGGGVSGWMWQKQWEAFGDYHVLIPDLPDHGKSMGEGKIDIADSADRVAALIKERANGGRAHVVGHSLGAKVIVQTLATHPEVIDRAVVASALFRPVPLMNLMLNMPAYRLTVWMLKSRRVLDMQARQFNFPNDFYRENFKREISAETPEILSRIYDQLNKYIALPEGLGGAHAPTLVLAGEKELKAMRLSVGNIARALPDAQGFLVKGALHNYPWAQYEVFNATVRAWLEGKEIAHPGILPL
jgi:pimeloyl-ACP methyl ester carboxylesterase